MSVLDDLDWMSEAKRHCPAWCTNPHDRAPEGFAHTHDFGSIAGVRVVRVLSIGDDGWPQGDRAVEVEVPRGVCRLTPQEAAAVASLLAEAAKP